MTRKVPLRSVVADGKQFARGAEYVKSTWSWYEGERYPVTWSFANGMVSIDGEDGSQCLLDVPVDELVAEEVTS